jgi:hypothetical protein
MRIMAVGALHLLHTFMYFVPQYILLQMAVKTERPPVQPEQTAFIGGMGIVAGSTVPAPHRSVQERIEGSKFFVTHVTEVWLRFQHSAQGTGIMAQFAFPLGIGIMDHQ